MIRLLDTSAVLVHHRREAGWERVHEFFEREDMEVLIASVSSPEMGRRLREPDRAKPRRRSSLTVIGAQPPQS